MLTWRIWKTLKSRLSRVKCIIKYLVICSIRWATSSLLRTTNQVKSNPLDLTILGHVQLEDGLGSIPIGIMRLFQNDLEVACLATNTARPMSGLKIGKAHSLRRPKSSKVSIITEQIATLSSRPHLLLPQSDIQIAYSMVESTRISSLWSKILNQRFDAVVVPDGSLIDVYRNSGVKIPIFMVPLGIDLHPFFAVEKSRKPNAPFVFGTTVSCDKRKNIPLLIKAFSEEFGNHQNIVLRINSRFGNTNESRALIDALGTKNIIFTQKFLNQHDYVNLMSSFDCFVNISKGEGFSICPRQAIALGIPCILTNHSAHTTICNHESVRSISCPIEQPAFERIYGKEQLGYFSTCSLEEVRSALRDMYDHYPLYLEKALQGKQWAASYQWENLKQKYFNLVQPTTIHLGDHNLITDAYLMTNSEHLYNKYKKL